MSAHCMLAIRGWCGPAVALSVAVLLATPTVHAQPSHAPDVIASWNSVAHDIAVAEDQFLTFKGQRALAMMHLAMHDALNAIVPVYQTYAFRGSDRLAHPIAAAAQAAHDVLLSQYPGRQVALAAQLTRWLAQAQDGVARTGGIDLGRATAKAILARRDGDGWDFPGAYEFTEGPGRYQTTPPWNGFVAQPGFRFATPFVLEYPHQFRPPPPPPLRTKAYARALREVQEYGAVDSMRRTNDQTAYAIWWMEFAEGLGQPSRASTRERSANASLGGGPSVRAHRCGAVRRLRRDVGREVRIQPLAPVHGHSGRRHRRQPEHDARRRLGFAASGAAVSGLLVGPCGGVCRVVRRAR